MYIQPDRKLMMTNTIPDDYATVEESDLLPVEISCKMVLG